MFDVNPNDAIAASNVTGETISVNPTQVFTTMGQGNKPDALNLSPDTMTSSTDALVAGVKSTGFAMMRGAAQFLDRQVHQDFNYNPFEDSQLKAKGNEFILNYKDGLSQVTNSLDMADSLKKIDYANDLTKMMSGHPVASTLGMIVGGAPEAILTALPFAMAASTAGRIAQGAVMGAGFGTGATLGQQQYDPTVTNSAIGQNALFGGIVGAALPLLFKGMSEANRLQMNKNILGDETGSLSLKDIPEEHQINFETKGSVGAASTKLDPVGEAAFVPNNAGGTAFKGAQKLESYLSREQELRLMKADYGNEFANEVFDSSLVLNKNTQGIRTQDPLLTTHEAAVINAETKVNLQLTDLHAEAKKTGFKGDSVEFFNQSVDDYMTGKSTPGGEFAKKIMNDYGKIINNEKVFGPDVVIDDSGNHFPLSLDKDLASKYRPQLREMLTKKLGSIQSSASNALADLKASIKGEPSAEHLAKIQEYENVLNDSRSIPERVDDLERTLLTPDKTVDPSLKLTGLDGAFKRKSLYLTYDEAKPFLKDNKVDILKDYIRKIELERLVKQRTGGNSKDWVQYQTSKFEASFNDKINALTPDNPKLDTVELQTQRKELERQYARAKTIVQDTFDMMTNRYGRYSADSVMGVTGQVSKLMRNITAGLYLGFSGLANVVDMANLPGLGSKFWQNEAEILGKEFDNIAQTIKLSPEDAEFMHITMSENAPTNRGLIAAGIDDQVINDAGKGIFTRGLAKAVDGSGEIVKQLFKWTGLNWVNNQTRTIAAQYVQNRMYGAMLKLKSGTLEQGSKLYNDLHRWGFDKTNIDIYLKQINDNVVTKKGILGNDYSFLNVHEWKDASAALDFSARVLRAVDELQVSRKPGDAPIWTYGPAQIFSQFKGWGYGTLNRVTLPMMQGAGMGRDYNALVGQRLLSNVLWGNLVSYAANIAKGNSDKNKFDANSVIYNGFNRGSMFPLISDVSNMADAYGYGLGSALGVQSSSRYYNTDFWGKVAPSLGIPGQLIGTIPATKRVLSGEGSAKDWQKTVKMVPGAYNIWTAAAINNMGK